MCANVFVTELAASDLIYGAGNPHLIWDGTEPRVITEEFYGALQAESGWLLIMTRDDLAGLDPDALTHDPHMLASRLTTFAGDLACERCRCTAS